MMTTSKTRVSRASLAHLASAQDDLYGHVGAVFTAPLMVLTGGMEDARSPYLVVSAYGAMFLLLERHNDDGEYQPQLFRAPAGLDYADLHAVDTAVKAITNADEATGDDELANCGILADGISGTLALDDALWQVLYDFRDRIAPGSVAVI